MQAYDLIGDIHGQAKLLRALLAKLGYREINGAYAHPERKVIFLGDYVDRGPAIREALQIVRGMTDAGAALAIMGNHEFNALAYQTPDGHGGHQRRHSSKNQHQHQATLDQLADPAPEEWSGWLDWFRTLPLALDLGGLRAVHAAWSDPAVALLRDFGPLTAEKLARLVDRHSPEGQAKEILLNGLEIQLPDGLSVADKEGTVRRQTRVRWWLDLRGQSYADAAFPATTDTPLLPIPPEFVPPHHAPYAADATPVFIGHYWLTATRPLTLQAPNIACLDYSVAKGGPMVAYRWDGEQQLDAAKFVSAEANAATA
jgi:diadenosine tetraphosphatase ApaH/serine/threonine PP2A family protein phosphatase